MATLVQPITHVIAIVLALSASLWRSACASPVEGLRPTTPDSPTRPILVSLDTWHAMIAFPRDNGTENSGLTTERNYSDPEPQSSALGSQHLYEEWGYAERA